MTEQEMRELQEEHIRRSIERRNNLRLKRELMENEIQTREADPEFSEQWARLTKAANVTTDAELAKLLEITPPSVTGVKRRQAIPLAWFQKIADMYKVSLDWLILGRDNKAPKMPVQSDKEPIIYPARYTTAIGNFGYDIDTKAHRIGISKSYIEQYASEDSFFIRMPDNSMYPSIKKNDLLLVDPKCQTFVVGSVYAVAWGNQMVVRRYDILPDKIVFTALSDRYEDTVLDSTDTKHHPRLIGRVVWIAREYW